ncbi:MAG TPA: hypothetical protein VFF26_08580 [Gallionella sp.]|nr:hypothetical protein [Gallionella sp.]
MRALDIENIKRFKFFIGGFHGPNHRFELNGGALLYLADGEADVLKPSPLKWRNFIAKLDAQGVWTWKKYYNNRDVCDGTQWELDIVVGDKRVKSGGSNNYPGLVKDPKILSFPENSPQFDAFLAALKNLTGKKIR